PIIGYAIGKPQKEGNNIFSICNMEEDKDYTIIDLTKRDFYNDPYIIAHLTKLLLEDVVNDAKISVSSTNKNEKKGVWLSYLLFKATPWVIGYKACKEGATECSDVIVTKPQYAILANNNYFGLEKPNEIIIDEKPDLINETHGTKKVVYVLASSAITLIHSLGDCEMEEGSGLPKLEEYGWCEPCTYATMAYSGVQSPPSIVEKPKLYYQNLQITNYLKNGILPILDFRKAAEYVDLSQCTTDINGQLQCPSNVGEPWIDEFNVKEPWTPSLDEMVRDLLQCHSNGEEPWICELRLLVRDNSLTNTNEGLGPVIVLVGNNRTKYMVAAGVAKEQTDKVKEICKKCLAAVPFYASADSYATEMYADNEVVITNYVDRDVIDEMSELFKKANNIDVAVIEFPIADVMIDYAKDSIWWNSRTAKEKADIVVERMYNYAWQINYEARKAGKQQPVPVVILFNLETNEEKGWPVFNSKDDSTAQENKRRFYADFFANIYLSRDKLRKAGVIGLVYAPLSAKGQTPPEYPANIGIVNLPTSFGSKFCSFQEGTYDFIRIALLNKINKITEAPKKCDIFYKKDKVQINERKNFTLIDLIGKQYKDKDREPQETYIDCKLSCEKESNMCKFSCGCKKCFIKDYFSGTSDTEIYDLVCLDEKCATLDGKEKKIECNFDNAALIDKYYKNENGKCHIIGSTKNVDIAEWDNNNCVLYCDSNFCKVSCIDQLFSPNPLELVQWNIYHYFKLDDIYDYKECRGSLSTEGYIYCEECKSGEKCTINDMICDDGTQCVAPRGTTGPYKCPKGLVSEKCQLCSEKTGTVSCLMRRYTEPKAIDRFAIGAGLNYDSYFKEIKYSSLTDADMDIIARLPKTDKCCLLDDENKKYTYLLTEMNAISSTPVIFATGQPSPQASLLQDCGFIDSTIINAQGGLKICGITMTPDEPLACKKTGEWVTYDK
ncbi:MAG: hypothetical protein QXZ30_00895, partial [Candidatus Bilamarchaeaceae archaeon]